MNENTITLARTITRAGSKQTYLTARLFVDRNLVDDCLRAYAYFRWADDTIDVAARSDAERVAFVERQRALVDGLYRNERPADLSAHECILADLIGGERREHGGLQSYIRHFLRVLEFDAQRRGCLISQRELAQYSNDLARAVMDGIQYFIGNERSYPDGDDRILAVVAAHITHMLRDMRQDIAAGYVNIPVEYLERHGIGPEDFDSPAYRAWVARRVKLARRYLTEGKRYLDRLGSLRAEIAGYLYCARYEGVLLTIERDGYALRTDYDDRRQVSAWLHMARLVVSVTLKHVVWRRWLAWARRESYVRS